MNPAILVFVTIAATIGAAIWVALHRHVIYPDRYTTPAPPARSRRRVPLSTRQREIAVKPAAIISAPVSSVATPNIDAETVAIQTIAKLIAAGKITETAALETVFNVKAGSSRRYKEVQAKLKTAQSELVSKAQPEG